MIVHMGQTGKNKLANNLSSTHKSTHDPFLLDGMFPLAAIPFSPLLPLSISSPCHVSGERGKREMEVGGGGEKVTPRAPSPLLDEVAAAIIMERIR